MSCITKLLEMKGDKEFLPLPNHEVVVEGGGVYKDHEFLITFILHGTRCGYVAVKPGTKYDSDEIHVHGGVTFESDQHGAKKLLSTPCNDIWIGFDAAHSGDMKDFKLARHYFGQDEIECNKISLMEEFYKEVEEMERCDPQFSHKTYEYIVSECHSVIDQLIEQAQGKVNENGVNNE